MFKFATTLALPIVIGIGIDQASKLFVLSSGIEYYLNYGFSGGYTPLENSQFFRVITVIYSLLLLCSVSLIYFFYSLSKSVCLWTSLLFAAFTSNVIDRFRVGGVIDFIPVPGTSIYMNVADLFQWIGFTGLIISLMRVGIIRSNENRLFQLVYPRSQIRMAMKFTFVSIFSTLSTAAFCYVHFSFLNPGLNVAIPRLALEVLSTGLIFWIVIFLIGLIISFQWLGPIYAFSKFVDQLNDSDQEFKLRKNDQLKELEDISRKVRKALRSKNHSKNI